MKSTPLLLLLCAACTAATASPDVTVRLRSNEAPSVIGAAHLFRIEVGNPTSSEVQLAIPPCGAALDIRDTNGHQVGPWSGTPCSAMAPSPIMLPPGATHSIDVQWNGSAAGAGTTPEYVKPGRYVLRAVVVLNGTLRASEPLQLDLRAP